MVILFRRRAAIAKQCRQHRHTLYFSGAHPRALGWAGSMYNLCERQLSVDPQVEKVHCGQRRATRLQNGRGWGASCFNICHGCKAT